MRLLFLICLFWSGPAFAEAVLPGPIPAEVLRVVDGDTVLVRAHIWVGQSVEVKVRLARVNAPETYRPHCANERVWGLRAKALMPPVGSVVELRQIHTGKYAGRVVAEMQDMNGTNFSDLLQASGLAVQQGERKNWCAAQSPSGAGVLSLNRQ